MSVENVCDVCGEPAEGSFCSPGCRDVSEKLGEPPRETEEKDGIDDGLEELFLEVEGMYSAISEDFLESMGEKIDGVEDVSASYITGSVKILHDGSVPKKEVRDSLSAAGHTAHLRGEDGEEDGDDDGGQRKGTDVSGAQTRREEPMIGVKHTVGIIIGGVILIPYMSLVYPSYVFSLLNIDLGYDLSAVDATSFLTVYLGLTGVVLYFTGLPLLRGAYIGLLTRKPNADMVVSLTLVSSYIYGTVAALVGRGDIYYDLTIVVASVVVSSIFYESSVKQRAVDVLGDLTSSRIDDAHLYADGEIKNVDVDYVSPGDRILVREGERVPLGGVLESDACTVDESVMTGESLPVGKDEGDEIVAGSTVTGGAATVRVTEGGSTGVREITRGVWDIQAADHGAERRINRIASLVVPVLVLAGIAVGLGYSVAGAEPAESFLATLTLFLAASPWGLALVAPLTSASNIRKATENGIVVFDETHFERLREIDTVVFDKTGTLTTGEMEVIDADGPERLLREAASLEAFTSHPAADAISDAFDSEIDEVENVETFSTGVSGEVRGRNVLVGNEALFDQEGWEVPEGIRETVAEKKESGRLPVIVGKDGEAEAVVSLSDQHREGWQETVSGLSEKGMEVVLLTGDGKEATRPFEAHEDTDLTFCEVPPKGKREAVRRLSDAGTVAMVGDGTNDALPLAEADFSVSMGGGTAVASDAADLAIVRDDIRLVEEAFELSEDSRRVYRRNLALSFLYNLVVAPVAVLGLLNPLVVISAASATAAAVWVNSFLFGP